MMNTTTMTTTTTMSGMATMTEHARSAPAAKGRSRQGAADKIWAVGLAGVTCVGLVGTMGVRVAQDAVASTKVPDTTITDATADATSISVTTSTGLTEQQLDQYARALEDERLRLEAYHAELLDAAAKLQQSADALSQNQNVVPASTSSKKESKPAAQAQKPQTANQAQKPKPAAKPVPKPAAAPQVSKPQAQTRGS